MASETYFSPGGDEVTATFTRPADTTAYAIGDLIANSTTAGSVIPMTFAVARRINIGALIWRIRAKCNIPAWKGSAIRVHLFRQSPTVSVGDNGAFNASETYASTESQYLGYADVTLTQQFSGDSPNYVKGFATASTITTPNTSTQNIFGLLEARAAITPTSGATFNVTLELDRD